MKPLIIANWKMSLNLTESIKLAEEVQKKAKRWQNKAEIVLCPSFFALSQVAALLDKIKLGAQDVFWETKGAYTGEISPSTLKELGCNYVIIGHSERRKYLAETDETVHLKVKAALVEGLIPVVCVGETLKERQGGQKDYLIMRQVTNALGGLEVVGSERLIIAYEPVWVIGTGQAITPLDAFVTHQVIRQTLIDLFPMDKVEKNFMIIYGGSVSSSNVKSFLEKEYIAGVLVGGASLKSEEFIKIIEKIV